MQCLSRYGWCYLAANVAQLLYKDIEGAKAYSLRCYAASFNPESLPKTSKNQDRSVAPEGCHIKPFNPTNQQGVEKILALS